MRIFNDFKEALGEIKRDLAEMGVKVHPHTMQDKDIQHDSDYETLEIQNYIYTVLYPRADALDPTQPWAQEEWRERVEGICGRPVNPGEAWKLREEVWDEFLHDGKFAYTYSHRLFRFSQTERVIERLKKDRDSRQLYVTMWDVTDSQWLGTRRVPCSLGWLFQCRDDHLNMTYFMRSCDFVTHMQNDIYLSTRFLYYVAEQSGLPVGRFSHYIGSLHIYQKDVEGVF